jgi:chloride channel protein, CIC family
LSVEILMRAYHPQPNLFAGGGAGGLSLRFWVLALVTGVGAGLGGGALMVLLRAVQHLAWSYRSGIFLDAVEQTGAARRIGVLVCAGLIVGLYRWLTKSNPGGHGGELAEAIWFRSGHVPALATSLRAVLSIVIVGLGASLGREAAPKQLGAAIASTLAGWLALSPPERRLLAACGAGAGMAAVYNVPLGGALFALEVLLGTLALPLVLPAFAVSLVATGVSWLMLPNVPTYSIPSYGISAAATVWAILAGPLAGFAAVAYIRLIAWADARKPTGRSRLVAPVVVFAALGLLAIRFPQLLGNGKDVVQEAFLGRIAVPLLFALFVLKPLATGACVGSGAPGGLFTPTLAYGALLGGVLGQAWAVLWPGAPPGSYAIIAAGAVLAATTAGPVSALVLLAELTHRVDAMLVPLMLAVTGAVLVARRLEPRSVYSARIHNVRDRANDRPPAGPTRFEDHLSDRFDVVSAAASWAEVMAKIARRGEPSRPLYVVDEAGRLVGAIFPAALSKRSRDGPLLGIATAADLAAPVRPLLSSAGRAEVLRRIESANGAPVPVVDPESGRPIGIAAARDH